MLMEDCFTRDAGSVGHFTPFFRTTTSFDHDLGSLNNATLGCCFGRSCHSDPLLVNRELRRDVAGTSISSELSSRSIRALRGMILPDGRSLDTVALLSGIKTSVLRNAVFCGISFPFLALLLVLSIFLMSHMGCPTTSDELVDSFRIGSILRDSIPPLEKERWRT